MAGTCGTKNISSLIFKFRFKTHLLGADAEIGFTGWVLSVIFLWMYARCAHAGKAAASPGVI